MEHKHYLHAFLTVVFGWRRVYRLLIEGPVGLGNTAVILARLRLFLWVQTRTRGAPAAVQSFHFAFAWH